MRELPLKYDRLKALSEHNSGVLQTLDAVKSGVSKTYFLTFVRENGYEKTVRGIYLAPGAREDMLYLLHLRYPSMTFSHHVELYLHGMTDHEPASYTATVPAGYNASVQKKAA